MKRSLEVADDSIRPAKVGPRTTGNRPSPPDEVERNLEVVYAFRITKRHPCAAECDESVRLGLDVTHFACEVDRHAGELGCRLGPVS